MRKRIYIAGPMSQGDRIHNLAQAMRAFRELIEAGFAPLCPQLTFFAEPFINQSHEVWLNIDMPWVAISDALLRLPGASSGADQETKTAMSLRIPVFDSIIDIVYHFEGDE